MRVMRAGAPVVVIALLLALCLALGLNGVQAQDAGGPLPGTVQEQRFLTFYGPAVTVSGTTYSATPLAVQGQDVSLVAAWHAADVFVTADVSGTATITVTPQLSADQVNWTDADYTYVGVNTTTVYTPGGTVSTSSAPTVQPYRVVLAADGTDYLRVPLAGQYLRFKIDAFVTVSPTAAVTPTIQVVLRND